MWLCLLCRLRRKRFSLFIWPGRGGGQLYTGLMSPSSPRSTNFTKDFTRTTHFKSPLHSQNFATDSVCDGLLCILEAGLNVSVLDVNATNSTIPNEEYNWGVLFLSPLMVFGVAGNLLVCMAVSMEKRLQSVTNYFLLSLAITDLLVCLIVMPFSIINEFIGYWLLGPVLCDLFVTADVLMCTSSILHLGTISLERYIAIRSPLTSRNKSKTVVILKIILVWATALAITSPITILGFVDERNVLNNQFCVLSNEEFIIYGSMFAFFIPLAIMVLAYSLTIHLLSQQAKLCKPTKSKEGQPMIRRSTSRKASRHRSPLKFTARRTKSCPPSNAECKYHSRHSQRLKLKASMSLPVKQNNQICEESEISGTSSISMQTIPEENHNKIQMVATARDSTQHPKRLQGLVKKHQLVFKAANLLLLKKDSTKKDTKVCVQTEQKASKVLGVVFTIFVICWAPFFIVNIMTALCKTCYFDPTLITVFVWLGYISSTLNPIIYTMFNNTFKMTFVKLLRCQYDLLQRRQRSPSWHCSNGSTHFLSTGIASTSGFQETQF